MKIEIWSDFVCPFCYIGKRKLENALETFSHRNEVTLEFKSYELDPESEAMPNETIHEHLSNKKGMSLDQAKQMNKNVGKQAEQVGLTYRFDTMQHTNTFDAHRLAKYAEKQGKGRDMAERLMHAYFTESKLISDYPTLAELAADVDLNKQDVLGMLESNEYTKHVREDESQAREIGVQGVPFFVFNEKYALSGAQPQEVFEEVLNQIWEEEQKESKLKSLNPTSAKTTYCTDEGCESE
ncbi:MULTISPECIES: DsbA family oxidoreductase [Virgibacillus]|uniref:Protein-disulfide isomerase n=2 Tax=Virgibacillus TaxID=84406 RepID=A0A024QEW0_9BACI|nr:MULTISPECIES: DsbA family oxidoreductase [Virgibacillus]EQB38888.1 hypothetical protein M948_00665 [Virgibacillus sp. CM-4]MYL43255.1 thioredoxin domain-containing protein [Virgibacillus massiliensis]GGJ66866.1 DSBA oxidoreductase [Virgibacillus kapii]CDQ41014.1 Protein-disulfide isomerase [Virgibacillus massiliensis]